ncbi:hypothetical protein Syun_017875 [Stephania yunnanensis]|uniref:Peptidase C14 caspase domain-containing protein n=1 Tax=Stephania yunnanensis TaxID=152371 RepID=A0AAP0JA19_9MAGN
MKRLATLVGCNYFNTPNELHGCINDVRAMRDALLSRFGFDPDHVEVLTDEPGSAVAPTGSNIMGALNRMVDRAEPGDVLFFHYSGHGTRVPTDHGLKHDEAIVPCDFNLITDVDFRRLVNRLPEGASFTIISDSCHSGGLIAKEKEQIGPSTINPDTTSKNLHKQKFIPFDAIFHHLASLSDLESLNIKAHLLGNLGENELGNLGSIRADAGVLLSGCQANETSADMNPSMGEGKAYGAFSNAVQMVLKENKSTSLSNRELVLLARKVLQGQGIVQQHPCLYCSDENADAPFLCQS